MDKYQVIVGNIGTVYSGNDDVEACKIFGEYVEQSESGIGRAGNESVTLMDNDEIALEHDTERDYYDELDNFLEDTLGQDAKYFKE